MFYRVNHFQSDEDGGVTVDWIILTAGAVTLALAAFTMISGGTEDLSNTLSTTVAERPVGD